MNRRLGQWLPEKLTGITPVKHVQRLPWLAVSDPYRSPGSDGGGPGGAGPEGGGHDGVGPDGVGPGGGPGVPDDGDTQPIPLRVSGSLADELLSPGTREQPPPGPVPPGQVPPGQVPPGQAPPEDGPRRPDDGRSRALKALGLVLVAVLAGVVWWLIRDEDAGETSSAGGSPPVTSEPKPTTEQRGDPRFRPAMAPVHDSGCARHAYGDIREFFTRTKCVQLSRGLFTTRAGGKRVLVSVSVVQMRNAKQARELKRLTDTDGTGNVADLVREGRAPMPNPPDVADGAYDSKRSGNRVTIVESNSFDERAGQRLLNRVSADALRLADNVEVG